MCSYEAENLFIDLLKQGSIRCNVRAVFQDDDHIVGWRVKCTCRMWIRK